MKKILKRYGCLILLLFLITGTACDQPVKNEEPTNKDCTLVENGFGPAGRVNIKVETVVTNLEVPWAIAFLPNGDALVTERPGRLRLVRDIYVNAQLATSPVADVETGFTSEGGLLGIALHPDFKRNRLFYMYITVSTNGGLQNKVEQWKLSNDGSSAQFDKVIYEGIAGASYHDGGRIRFGPDGMLYAGTGDAGNPDLSQKVQSPNGKILRLTPEGDIPDDNPFDDSPAFVMGIRNTQGFDWPDATKAGNMWIVDHGPSGEMGRTGHDEVNIASAGDNLGWPTIYGCEQESSMKPPILTWEKAVPPGGAAIYTGNAIQEWKGSLIMGTLGSRHLHRVVVQNGNVSMHEVYLQNEYGRLREVIMGSDGELYVATSNCDGRGECPEEQDMIIRISK